MDSDREPGRAEGKAFRLLARRAHSEKELREKLKAGGFSGAVIDGAVRRCRELGYLNDEAFAIQRARMLATGRLEGDRRIADDLRERGIDGDVSRLAIAEARGELTESDAAERFLRKRVRGRPHGSFDEQDKARLARALMRKGYSTGLIWEILKKTEEAGFHDDDGE